MAISPDRVVRIMSHNVPVAIAHDCYPTKVKGRSAKISVDLSELEVFCNLIAVLIMLA